MILQWIFWRRTRARLDRATDQLITSHGDQAFFRAHSLAWTARGEGRGSEARFWEAVCRQICGRIRRREVVAAMLSRRAATRLIPQRRPPEIASRPLTIIARGRSGQDRREDSMAGVQG